ncbi:SUMF1/EgtB/PvdO family nonheme iron enzyme [Pontiellaceae bacterium B12227]|nr:SUMF1/EgtB/PvdO family nonheme iron enzyme [Pontiellaceae bacterium B12227]
MKKIILTLVALSGITCFSDAAFLEEIAEAQLAVAGIIEKARHDGGADGMKWRYFDVTQRSFEVEISGFENPQILIVPARRGRKTNGRYAAIHDGQAGDSYRMSSGEYSVIKLRSNMLDADAIQIDLWSGACEAWVAESKTIGLIIKKYINPGMQVYSRKWGPLLEKYGISADEFYFELKAMKGSPFPTSPKTMALAYANACSEKTKKKAVASAKLVQNWTDAEQVRQYYLADCRLEEIRMRIEMVEPQNIRLALEDLDRKFPNRKVLQELGGQVPKLIEQKQSVLAKIEAGAPDARQAADALMEEYRTLMLANPLLDDMELLAIQREVGHLNLRDEFATMSFPGRIDRGGAGAVLGAPSLSTHSIVRNISSPNKIGWNSSIVKLSNLRGQVQTTPLYAPEDDQMLISNARLHWDGERVAFSMGSYQQPMTLFELNVKNGQTKQLTPDSKDHFFDPCYLPDGNIIVMSTAIMTALACEGGSHMLANMYVLNPETQKIRQLGVDQENSYHATVQEDGRVLYIRYEYTDAAHYFMRIMMNMNPDGSNQREIYGSNSVWPTALFYPQQVPGEPNLYTATVAGHHGPTHMGPMVLFDMSKGRREADGAVQFIGEKEKPVEAVMVDRLYNDVYPKFMYSVPLDKEYHIAMMKPGRFDPWGLYLVDVFDNKTLIHQPREGFLAWPQVLKKKPTPPVIPSRVREDETESTIYVQDIYEGPGLEGIKRGDVKELAVYAFHYGYKSAASHRYIGHESGWDARYMLGTVPVNEDGSAMFKVPSMMPISFLALDQDGMALQKMRTWMNPQPGENLSCIGCHETADHAPVNRPTQAFTQQPHALKPWYGEARPYSFVMEVQPVLDKYCVSCHDEGSRIDLTNSFSKDEMLASKRYSKSYSFLQKYVRRNGPESNPELMVPMEWHASSSTLIQMMKKGHHGVQLDDEAMRRLTMWIDLNVPFHAAFHPGEYGEYGDQVVWRRESLKEYAGLDWDPENQYKDMIREFVEQPAIQPVKPAKVKPVKMPKLPGWPFEAKGGLETMSLEFGGPGRTIRSYDKGRGIAKRLTEKERLDFVKIPAGAYVMGSATGYPNETPRVVEILKPFWMSVAEISNSQLQTFDPQHDSRFADMPEKDQTQRGVPLFTEDQPAVRVSHTKALDFCEWLSKETGKKVSLPTEEQWEWAARAGTGTDTWYGSGKTDFGQFANLSDASHGRSKDFTRRSTPEYFQFVEEVKDGHAVTAPVKSYKPNAWGLYNMIGNAEEWTASKDEKGNYIVKGGSWFDMPKNAMSATRWGYHEDIRLPDLGFRIIIEE